jgi:hypothetical protein
MSFMARSKKKEDCHSRPEAQRAAVQKIFSFEEELLRGRRGLETSSLGR